MISGHPIFTGFSKLMGCQWDPRDRGVTLCVTCHITWLYPTPDASKDKKFRLSRNPMKFDWAARFHETNSMMKSVSSSEI